MLDKNRTNMPLAPHCTKCGFFLWENCNKRFTRQYREGDGTPIIMIWLYCPNHKHFWDEHNRGWYQLSKEGNPIRYGDVDQSC